MTVIVYRDGVMAADGACWRGEVCITLTAKKIARSPSGGLLGCAGPSEICEAAIASFREGKFEAFGRTKESHEWGAIAVTPDGKVFTMDGLGNFFERKVPWATEGSHTEFLAGALCTGATAEQAVRLAVERCLWAAGEIQVERLGNE